MVRMLPLMLLLTIGLLQRFFCGFRFGGQVH